MQTRVSSWATEMKDSLPFSFYVQSELYQIPPVFLWLCHSIEPSPARHKNSVINHGRDSSNSVACVSEELKT